ncbi:hypothetical protein EAH88_17155 [Rhodanobacter glycinis]|uniref:Transposase n=1 Tax=Rhodanobacter glycinis TaxID=582702 RepID=A0A502BU09_9GAMM|nr:hypothetical protein EAH88_17155 [Rhodanobacter glycinis]
MKQVEAGLAVAELCRRHCVSTAIVYLWRSSTAK